MAAGLFLVGLGTGTWDVAMNLQGTEVERLLGRNVMPHYHAWFSLGAVGGGRSGRAVHLGPGAGRGALRAHRGGGDRGRRRGGAPVPAHRDRRAERPGSRAPVRRNPLAAWLEPRTLLIGVLVLAAAFTEGSALDWLSVGIIDGYGTAPWVGVLGFAAFVSAMTVGRVLGTSWLDRYGRVPVLWASFALAGVGALLVILGPALGLVAAFGGALFWGLGTSLGFPVGLSAAADDPRHAAARVSVVASIGYLAFLAGPPLLGFLGDHVGVLHALLAVVAISIPALLVVPATRPLPTPR